MADVKMGLHYKVDADAPLNVRTLPTLLAEGDKEANRITIELMRGGEKLSADGMTVEGSMTRADGNEVPIDGSVSGNVVTAELNEYCYAVGGPFGLYVQLIGQNGGIRRTILLLTGYVQEKGHGEMIDTGKPLPSLEELFAQLETMRVVTSETAQAGESARAATSEAEEAANDANEAAGSANAAAQEANTAAASAVEAIQYAEAAGNYVGNTTVGATKLEPGSEPTAQRSTVDGHMHISFGLVTGDKGDQGEPYLIKGHAYATLAQLQADITNPEVGDQYNVGTATPYNIYRWTGSYWEDQGQLKGVQGDPGVGVKSVTQTTVSDSDGGTNVWRMTMTDGTTANFQVKNGSKGSKGDTGATGATGAAGKDGYTPVKGTDYFTASDKAELVNDVLAALPTWNGGSY